MSQHHGDRPFGDMPEGLREIFEGLPRAGFREQSMRKQLLETVGPTGRFPEGQLTKHDEGEMAFAVGVRGSKIVLEFGSQVTWLGFDGEHALQLAEILIEKARQVGCKRPVSIKV